LGAYSTKATEKALRFDTTGFSKEIQRQMATFKSVDLKAKDAEELNQILSEMTQIYGAFQVTTRPSSEFIDKDDQIVLNSKQ